MDGREKGQLGNSTTSSHDFAEPKPKPRCSSCTRVLVGLTIFFIVTTVLAVAILAWRELRRQEDRSLTSSTIRMAYPGYFRSMKEQEEFKKKFKPPVLVTEKIVNLNKTAKFCSVNCLGGEPARKKRDVSSDTLFHGCCESSSAFESPDTKDNLVGNTRTIVHLPDARQFFQIQSCGQANGCTGCNCMQEQEINTAVVFKPGKFFTDDSELDDVEIDWFYFDGCCKCINT